MRHVLPLGCLLLSLSVPACSGETLGIGALLMQGSQMAGGAGSMPGASKNSAPFARQSDAQERRTLDDVASRPVSQSCVTEKNVMPPTGGVISEPPTGGARSEPRGVAAPRHCGYRDICLAGHARPVRMLICERPVTTPDRAAQTAAESSY
jgi:hypothetical protein